MIELRIMPKAALGRWVDFLLENKFKVIGPVEKHGKYVFSEITHADMLMIDYDTTVLPPKKHLLPQREELFSFDTRNQQTYAAIEVERTVILGIHTCDMHALDLLDKVHSTGYADQHYQARRAATYLVSFECLKPCSSNAFCKSMGTLAATETYDLHFTDLGDRYAVQIGSDKGAALLEGSINIWNGNGHDARKLNKVMSEKWSRFDYKLDFDVSQLPTILAEGQQSPLWDELGERCLACGMCTKVCPTCYCFDVSDEVDLKLQKGKRVRIWDSCQIEKFAVVAGGHNFRTRRALRQRHRFMRKGKYQYEAYGLMGCVGCGRCAEACLVHITPVDTYNALYREQHPELVEQPANAPVAEVHS
ncbi:MAG TPA: 4Fe-4S dicluster domain-containing protein [Aggregatilineales bacterium]|jgi:heterodisulfide reductase subunit C|nr:4Fe-4S dicluster domain-containing protein [Aggregatilineales bacterium]